MLSILTILDCGILSNHSLIIVSTLTQTLPKQRGIERVLMELTFPSIMSNILDVQKAKFYIPLNRQGNVYLGLK